MADYSDEADFIESGDFSITGDEGDAKEGAGGLPKQDDRSIAIDRPIVPAEGEKKKEEQDAMEARARRYQSKADKLQKELDDKIARQKELEVIEPLHKILKQNPDLINVIEKELARKQDGEVLEPPKAPVRPTNYDETAAYSDPTSESFRYRMQREDHRDAMLQFTLQKTEIENKRLREALVARDRKAEQEKQNALIESKLIAAGVKPEGRQKFWEDLQSGKMFDPDNLVSMYTRTVIEDPSSRREKQEYTRRSVLDEIPGVGGGGGAPRKRNAEEDFNADLAALARRY